MMAPEKQKCFDADQGIFHAKRTIEGLLKESSSTYGAKGETRQINSIIQSCLGRSVPAKYTVPLPIFDAPIPGLQGDMLKELQTDSNKKSLQKFHHDSDALTTDNAAAAVFILRYVQEGSKSMNILMGDQNFAVMMKSGALDALVVAKAIVSTHITNPGGVKGTDMEIAERRINSHTKLANLKIEGGKIHEFANSHKQAVDDRDSEAVTPLSDLEKMAYFMGAVKKSTHFSEVYFGIMNLSLPTPETTAELYQMCCRHHVRSPAAVADGGMMHVLATTLDNTSQDDASKKKNEQRQNHRRVVARAPQKTPGKQLDGSIWFDSVKWAAMSADKRKQIGEQNAVARDKYKKQKKTEEAAKASALLTTTAVGEYSDDDIDGPYCSRALLVAPNVRRSAKSLKSYDQHMADYNRVDASGELVDSKNIESDSDVSDGNSSFDGYRSSSVSSDGSASQKVKELQLIQRLRATQQCSSSQSVNTHHSSVIDSGMGVKKVPIIEEKKFFDIFAENQTKSPLGHTTTDIKGFSSLKAGDQVEVQKTAGGTGILSRLSWLFMFGAVAVAYFLGAMRNSSAAGVAPMTQQQSLPAPMTPAAGSGPHPPHQRQDKHRVLMVNKDSKQKFRVFGPNNLVFDPGSGGISLLRERKYLYDIVSCDSGSVGGINDNSSSLHYDHCGTIVGTHISNVVHCPGAIANILCPQSAIDQGYTQEYVSDGDYYTLTHPREKNELKFGRVNLRNGGKTTLYIMDLRTLLPPIDQPLVLSMQHPTIAMTTTVTHNKARYTKREVMQADKARRYLSVMGNPPLRAAIEQLRSTLNAPVCEADLKRCFDIYGPSTSSLKANTTKRNAPAARSDTEPPDEVPTHVFMEVDVMFVKGSQYLVGVALPLDYAMCVPLSNGRGASNLEKGLKSMAAKLRSRNFVCDSIRADNEGGISKQSTTQEIQRLGIELMHTGAGQHCAHVERRIRWVKEKYRSIEHALAHAMNKLLVSWAVLCSVRQTNMQRTASSTSLLSPREKFMGRAFNYDLDGRVAFGSYIQSTVRDTNNTASARTEGCIALFSRDNLTGSIYALHIATQEIVVRDHFVELPMPDALVSYMDKLAAKDGLSRGSEPFADSEYGAPTDEYLQDDSAVTNKQPTFKPFNESSAGEHVRYQESSKTQ